MLISELYSKVIDLYQDKSRFSQGHYQRNINGEKCGWSEGYSFCALGALGHFTWPFGLDSNMAQCCLQRVSEHLFDGRTIQKVNDEDGLEKVLIALEFARKLWEGRVPSYTDIGCPVNKLPWFKENV